MKIPPQDYYQLTNSVKLFLKKFIDLIFSLNITPVSISQNEKDIDTEVILSKNKFL